VFDSIVKPKRTNWPRKIAGYILGGFNSLLLGASVLVFVSWKPLGEPNPAIANLALAVVLLVVVAVSALFNAYQDFSTSRVMQSIAGMLPSEVEIMRDGNSMKVPARDLVTGDILKIGLGNKVPCDCRVLETTADAQFDRSVLTGEVAFCLAGGSSAD
jgi:sodium/potassium-transporting ATPase subunit alpha